MTTRPKPFKGDCPGFRLHVQQNKRVPSFEKFQFLIPYTVQLVVKIRSFDAAPFRKRPFHGRR